MPETHATLTDRVAALEADNRELWQLLLARERQARGSAPDPVRWVKTKAAGGTLAYPAWPARRLPVIFLDLTDNGDDTTTYGERDTQTQFMLAAPVWIPETVALPVSWHHGLYWPLWIPNFKGVVSESGGIAADAAGEITVWLAGAATSQTLQARYDWFHDGETLPAGRQVLVEFRWDQEEYVIVDWQCG